MADDSGAAEAQRERKRAADRQLTKGGPEDDRHGPEEEPTGNTKAPPEVLAQRRIVRVKRTPEMGTAAGLFASVNVKGPAAAPAAALGQTGFGAARSPKAAPAVVPNPFGKPNPFSAPAAAAAAPAKETESVAAASVASTAGSSPAPSGSGMSPTSFNAPPNANAVPSVFGANANFKFSFSAPPPRQEPAKEAASTPAAPATTVTLQQIEKEEDPFLRTLFAEQMKLFEKKGDAWEPNGHDVVVKVVVHEGDDKWASVGVFVPKTMRHLFSASVGPAFRLGKQQDRQVSFTCIKAGYKSPTMYTLRAPKDREVAAQHFVEAVGKAELSLSGAGSP